MSMEIVGGIPTGIDWIWDASACDVLPLWHRNLNRMQTEFFKEDGFFAGLCGTTSVKGRLHKIYHSNKSDTLSFNSTSVSVQDWAAICDLDAVAAMPRAVSGLLQHFQAWGGRAMDG